MRTVARTRLHLMRDSFLPRNDGLGLPAETVARRAATVLLVGGTLGLINVNLPTSPFDHAGASIVAASIAVLGLVGSRFPWHRFPDRSTLALPVLVVAIMTVGEPLAVHSPAAYLPAIIAFMVLALTMNAMLGFTHPPGTTLRFAPILAAAYTIPKLLPVPHAPFIPGIVLVTVPLSALIGEFMARNLAERRRAETEVLTSREQLAEAQHLAHLGSWRWDTTTNDVTWSDEMFRIYGLEPGGTAPGPHELANHVHPDDLDAVLALMTSAAQGNGPVEADYRVRRTDGEERWLHATGEAVLEHGDLVALHGTAQDVTERTLAEASLLAALEREREAADALRAVDEMKNSIMAAVSHELRTPLAVVLGLAQTLQTPGIADEREQQTHLLSRLEANAVRLDRLLADLLDLDRIRRGIIQPRRRPTDFQELMRRVLDTLETDGHPVYIDDEPATLSVDGPQVERIIENLVTNAIRHTARGTPIWIRTCVQPEGVLLIVEDTGPGVPDAIKDVIFEPFRQGGTSAKGTGIGLSLVARFAELHGGRAWVDDRDGGGASFRVLLPDGDEDLQINGREPSMHSA